MNGSNGAGDVADPLVALRVTLSTNVFWFVKLSVAVFRTLSTKLGIPLSVGNTDDGGVDVQARFTAPSMWPRWTLYVPVPACCCAADDDDYDLSKNTGILLTVVGTHWF